MTDPVALEAVIEEQLRRLPQPRAPRTLLPRVMASVREWRCRPWYARSWFTWPVWWQAASMTGLVLLCAAATVLVPGVFASVTGAVWTPSARLFIELHAALDGAGAMTNAAGVVWRTLLAPLAPVALGVAALMWLACVGLGTLLNRIVLPEVLQR